VTDSPEPTDSDGEYGLVMPFVAVTSKGGPWDDDAYCAGYEMGALDVRLEQQADRVEATVQAGNREQADLLAMRHGYRAEYEHTDVGDWVYMRFTRHPAQ
jgi:hypothetical protein